MFQTEEPITEFRQKSNIDWWGKMAVRVWEITELEVKMTKMWASPQMLPSHLKSDLVKTFWGKTAARLLEEENEEEGFWVSV